MSKCREEFKRAYPSIPCEDVYVSWQVWQAAWNARGKVDAEALNALADSAWSIKEVKGLEAAIETIEQEQCE